MPPGQLQNHKVPEGRQAGGKGLSVMLRAQETQGKHKLTALLSPTGPPTPVFLWSVHYFGLLNKLKGEWRSL